MLARTATTTFKTTTSRLARHLPRCVPAKETGDLWCEIANEAPVKENTASRFRNHAAARSQPVAPTTSTTSTRTREERLAAARQRAAALRAAKQTAPTTPARPSVRSLDAPKAATRFAATRVDTTGLSKKLFAASEKPVQKSTKPAQPALKSCLKTAAAAKDSKPTKNVRFSHRDVAKIVPLWKIVNPEEVYGSCNPNRRR
ncbi:hypothetical protein H2203_005012 [Taxawa tesnikishii (nom. ined.)]|nr:hypothetical protein H2203_005012 [Dothideales sp. JES 119]